MSTKKWSPKVRGCPVFFQSEGDFVAPEYGIEKGEIVLKQIWHSEDHGQQWRSYSSPINFYVWSLYQQFSEDTTNSGYPFFITDNAVFFFIWYARDVTCPHTRTHAPVTTGTSSTSSRCT